MTSPVNTYYLGLSDDFPARFFEGPPRPQQKRGYHSFESCADPAGGVILKNDDILNPRLMEALRTQLKSNRIGPLPEGFSQENVLVHTLTHIFPYQEEQGVPFPLFRSKTRGTEAIKWRVTCRHKFGNWFVPGFGE